MAGGDGQGWCLGAGAGGGIVVGKMQDLRFLISGARAGARMAFDHALGSEEGLDLLSDIDDIAALLEGRVRTWCSDDEDVKLPAASLDALPQSRGTADEGEHRFGSFPRCSSARRISGEASVAEIRVGRVANLATDPTGVATRLSADRAFGLGRSGSFCRG